MAVCRPADLSAAGDDIREDVGGGPGVVGGVGETGDFGVGGVGDAQACG